jgi:hypothetical protein
MSMPDLSADLAHGLDPACFAVDRLDFTPDPWQAELLRSDAPQIITCCSRQSGKSSVIAVKTVHRAIYEPGALCLALAPSLRQSREIFGIAMNFMRRLTPSETLEADNLSSCTLANGSRIIALPGDPKTIRGFSGPSIVAVDEAAFIQSDDLYTAIKPMVAVSRGQIILASTPNGRRGFFFNVWQDGGDAWRRFSISADQCPRIDKAFLERERAELGEWRWKQEYFGEFVQASDDFFNYETIRAAFSDEIEPLFGADEIAHLATTTESRR